VLCHKDPDVSDTGAQYWQAFKEDE
jgi:hypothetical protein